MTTLKTSSAIFPVKAVVMAALTNNKYQTVALVARKCIICWPTFMNARLAINVTVLI